jgi:hypothetical protein
MMLFILCIKNFCRKNLEKVGSSLADIRRQEQKLNVKLDANGLINDFSFVNFRAAVSTFSD